MTLPLTVGRVMPGGGPPGLGDAGQGRTAHRRPALASPPAPSCAEWSRGSFASGESDLMRLRAIPVTRSHKALSVAISLSVKLNAKISVSSTSYAVTLDAETRGIPS